MAKPGAKALLDACIGASAGGVLHALKLVDRRRAADFAGALMRRIGPRLKEHDVGRDNLRVAFPEKSAAEIDGILAGVWDNLGRIAVEFAHLGEFQLAGFGKPTRDDIIYSPQTTERAERIISGGKPIIAFAAHLANWELPAVGCKLVGASTAVLYRRPNIRSISDLVVKLRAPLMGELVPTGLDAPVRLGRLLQSGTHVGMLVDQFFFKGVDISFFGRSCRANPLAAMLARQTGYALHGIRVVRLADKNSFSIELTEAVEPARDAEGRIDVQGTTQRINSVIEGWIREYPEQWLWLHRRWRRADGRGFEVED
jgi:Kdo2-lipid IVA lauroyltransferase/acyltransferase